LALADVEAKTEIGWHQASNTRLQSEMAKPRYVYADSNVVVHIIAPSEGTAVRGEVYFGKTAMSFMRELRWRINRLGVFQLPVSRAVLGQDP